MNERVSNFFVDMGRLERPRRRVWVYLPPDYAGGSRRYPVLYMQDGQNLFDEAASFRGSWRVDEALDGLVRQGRGRAAIVVGIDNGRAERASEYCPWDALDAAPRGRALAYADFVALDLKPVVDNRYRTLPGREHTAVAGSSLGGLISLTIALRHQGLFSRAGVLSPAFHFAREPVLKFVRMTPVVNSLRVYMDVGTDEGPRREEYLADARAVDGLLAGKGLVRRKLVIDEGGVHHESAWGRRFPEAFRWLMESGRP